MEKFTEVMLSSRIESSKKFCFIASIAKAILAVMVLLAYFLDSNWLIELLVFSTVIVLVLPLGFYGAFLENLIEYNTQKIESRQILNANEANEHFTKMHERIEELEDLVE